MQTIRLTNKAFTLVEIMIVVAIIGVLLAVSIPALMRLRINANDGAVKGDLRAFITAIENYHAAQNFSYPNDFSDMTTVTPPYLDISWGATTTVDKHGHTFTYQPNATGYVLTATSLPSLSAAEFCVDQRGTLFNTTVNDGTVCTGATI